MRAAATETIDFLLSPVLFFFPPFFALSLSLFSFFLPVVAVVALPPPSAAPDVYTNRDGATLVYRLFFRASVFLCAAAAATTTPAPRPCKCACNYACNPQKQVKPPLRTECNAVMYNRRAREL